MVVGGRLIVWAGWIRLGVNGSEAGLRVGPVVGLERLPSTFRAD